jgi:hypothetical protein
MRANTEPLVMEQNDLGLLLIACQLFPSFVAGPMLEGLRQGADTVDVGPHALNVHPPIPAVWF